MPDGHNDIMVDSVEILCWKPFLKIGQRLGTRMLCSVNEMDVAHIVFAANVAEILMCDALEGIAQFQYYCVGIVIHLKVIAVSAALWYATVVMWRFACIAGSGLRRQRYGGIWCVFAAVSIYLTSATVFTASATFSCITASFPEQAFPEIGPFAVGNRHHRAAFHPHVVPSALRGDDFRHMMEVDDGVVVDVGRPYLLGRFPRFQG